MLKDLVKKNRSYRGYDETYQFTKEELIDFVDHAKLAPSSVNAQPFRYVLAWEKEKVDRIRPLTKWARALPELELPHKGKWPTGFIIICQDLRISESLSRYQKDVGICAQTILLAAVEKGLGGCMIGNFNANEVKTKLNLSDYLAPMLIIALGKPDETILLEEIEEGESIKYYRDEADRHHVPKRKIEDIIVW
ncbi:MAG: nitroreductase family protein [Lachnospiraceae bacterium]|nr:nitroreductase family protein [Lachnospiraceae bacterium]